MKYNFTHSLLFSDESDKIENKIKTKTIVQNKNKEGIMSGT